MCQQNQRYGCSEGLLESYGMAKLLKSPKICLILQNAYYCYSSSAISSLGVKFHEITSHLHICSLFDAFQICIYIENNLNSLKIKRCNCLKCYNFLKMLQF